MTICWEYGVLIQSRDLARALREVLSRSQSQSQEDVDLTLAEPRINFQSTSWALPATESEYRDARRYINSYLNRLPETGEDSAQFYARADNLSFWLGMVEKRLGSLSQRLSASVGQRRINTDLAGDSAATQSTMERDEFIVKTPWHEVDDVYYESRGVAYALIHFLRAAEVDFADVLEKKMPQPEADHSRTRSDPANSLESHHLEWIRFWHLGQPQSCHGELLIASKRRADRPERVAGSGLILALQQYPSVALFAHP